MIPTSIVGTRYALMGKLRKYEWRDLRIFLSRYIRLFFLEFIIAIVAKEFTIAKSEWSLIKSCVIT